MANMLFANNAATTLASSITNSATSLTVATGTGALFPSPTGSQYFYCTLIDAATNSVIEIIKVTARSTDTFTIVRAQDGTTASAYVAGDKVELRLVRASLNDFPKLDESNSFTTANTSQGFNAVLWSTTPTITPTAGTSYWNTTQGAVETQFDANVSGTETQDNFYYIKASAAITKGQVCYVTGSVGASGVMTAAPASGNIDGQNILGIAAESIALNGFGYIQWSGTLQGINLSSYTAGQKLYYDPTVTGGLTATTPAKTSVQLVLGVVINAISNGTFGIKMTYYGQLEELSEISITSAATGQLLQYSSGSLWQNVNPSSVTGVGSANNIASGAANQIPYQTGSGATSFITAPSVANSYLYWTGSAFAYGTPTGSTTITSTTTNATYYLDFQSATSGSTSTDYVNSNITVNPSTGQLTSPELAASNGLVLNSKTVSTSYTIPSGYNASSVGPVTVSSGQAITITAGSRWVVF